MKKPHLQLNEQERDKLETTVAKGEAPVRVVKRALALLALDRGETLESVAAHLHVTHNTVAAWCFCQAEIASLDHEKARHMG
jgi:hypothetical protein